MTSAPILRSAALQRALAGATGKIAAPSAGAGSFATTLAKAQSGSTSSPSGSLGAPKAGSARAPKAGSRQSSVRTGIASPLTGEGGQGGVEKVGATQAGVSGAVPFASEIEAAARRHGVDPSLLAGLVKAESNFNPNAQSGVGAKGLTQLMDATARGLGVSNSFDPQQSLEGGAKFLGGLLKQFKGDERLALAAYNAGPGAVKKYGGIPPYQETQRYVPKVLGFADQYRRIWADSTDPQNG